MKGRRLYALSALALVLACQDQKVPTALTARNAPTGPSSLISDGAHGGNPDFFFLPPMVSDPSSNLNFDQGKFNPTLQPSLTVEICELQGAPVDANGLPVVTDCIAGPPVKKFPAGTVKLQQVDPDGYYQVVWNTQQSNLDVTKYYRIKVLIEGASVPFGVADIDPVSNMKEFKNAHTGEVIPLNDDSTLPIKFRVERGAACNGGLCNSVTVTNSSPTGSTIVTLDEGSGAVAGANFPNGWLPSTGPQSVVVTIADVNTGTNDPATGSETVPCHTNLFLQQFRGCFNFSTTPALASDPETGAQFATLVTVAVCYVLEGTGDPRETFAEIWSSGLNEPPHALADASDGGILSVNTRNCSSNVIGLNDSKGVTGLASTGWRKLKTGLGRLFGVQTAYAVDLGLGGFTDGFSNVGPALSAEIEPVGATALTVAGGGTVVPFVRIVGSNHHDGEHQNTIGIGGIPVTFDASVGTTISPQGTEGGTATQLTVISNTLPIDGGPTSGGGYAAVNWTIPNTPGISYTLTVNGLATGGPVMFTATVPALPDLIVSTGTPTLTPATISTSGGSVTLSSWTITNQGASFVTPATVNNGFYLSTDPVITADDVLLDQNTNTAGVLGAGASFVWGGPTLTIPPLAAGTYYIGILVDFGNALTESNEGNNYVSAPLIVTPIIP
jgi:hypothetical protein